MKKKTYTEPQVEVRKIKLSGSLLVISGDTEFYHAFDEEIDAEDAL